MKTLLNCLVALLVLLSLPLKAEQRPPVSPPTVEDLRALELPDSATVTVSSYSNSKEFSFAIFECKSKDRVCYLFRSSEIDDFVSSGSKFVTGELELMSRKQALKYFVVRFRGIANDLLHSKWRPDVIDKVIGPLKPVHKDTATLIAMHWIVYDKYAAAMEEVLENLGH